MDTLDRIEETLERVMETLGMIVEGSIIDVTVVGEKIDLWKEWPEVAESLTEALNRAGYDATATFLHAEGYLEAQDFYHDEKPFFVHFQLDNLDGCYVIGEEVQL